MAEKGKTEIAKFIDLRETSHYREFHHIYWFFLLINEDLKLYPKTCSKLITYKGTVTWCNNGPM